MTQFIFNFAVSKYDDDAIQTPCMHKTVSIKLSSIPCSIIFQLMHKTKTNNFFLEFGQFLSICLTINLKRIEQRNSKTDLQSYIQKAVQKLVPDYNYPMILKSSKNKDVTSDIQ